MFGVCRERKEKNIKGKEKNIQMAIIRRSVSVTSLRLYNTMREYILDYVCMCVCVCGCVYGCERGGERNV